MKVKFCGSDDGGDFSKEAWALPAFGFG